MDYLITKSLNLVRASSQNAEVGHSYGLASWGTFTMECSFKLSSLPTLGQQYTLGTIGWSTIGAHFAIRNSGGVYQLVGYRHAWNTGTTEIFYNFTPVLGDWYHVSFSKDSYDNAELTMNGVSVKVDAVGNATGTSGTVKSTIGAMWNNGSSYANYFDGKISLFRIWSVKRTATEIANNRCNVFDSPTTGLRAEYSLNDVYTDASGNGYTLTGVNSPTFTVGVSSFCLLLDTSPATAVSKTFATLNGEVIQDGNATITTRGFAYALTTNPTTADNTVTTSGTTGVFSVNLTGITPVTQYYVRAYAINANGTVYGDEISFTTTNVDIYNLIKDIGATDGEYYIGRITVTGTTGSITVKLGTTGAETTILAGSGVSTFSGVYSGVEGLIITRTADFNGAIDDVYYTKVPLGTTIDWTKETVTILSAIDSSVFFKRIEDDVFNSFRFYRYLDLLFKDLDGYVTVTVRDEREDITTEREKTFSVGNTSSGTVSPFQKKRVSFLIKNQAVIIGLSNASLNETFSIAQFILSGHKKSQRTFSPNKIQSLS